MKSILNFQPKNWKQNVPLEHRYLLTKLCTPENPRLHTLRREPKNPLVLHSNHKYEPSEKPLQFLGSEKFRFSTVNLTSHSKLSHVQSCEAEQWKAKQEAGYKVNIKNILKDSYELHRSQTGVWEAKNPLRALVCMNVAKTTVLFISFAMLQKTLPKTICCVKA